MHMGLTLEGRKIQMELFTYLSKDKDKARRLGYVFICKPASIYNADGRGCLNEFQIKTDSIVW